MINWNRLKRRIQYYFTDREWYNKHYAVADVMRQEIIEIVFDSKDLMLSKVVYKGKKCYLSNYTNLIDDV